MPPSLEDIERLARAALDRLPDPFSAHLAGVLLIVEEFAEDSILADMGIESPFELSGLYSGRPILDEWCETSEALDHLVAHVVVHEVGHHFGLSDADIQALEEAVS
jgi:predicted Zn-dependent protease with MMP-like domain